MAKNKNNTCFNCGEFIDKSDTSQTWITIIKAKYNAGEDCDKFINGYRITFCWECLGLIDNVVSKITHKKIIGGENNGK